MACGLPRYGIWTMAVSVMRLNSSPLRWPVVPLPAEPMLSAPGFDLASAISSFTEATGKSLRSTSAFCT